MKINWKARFKNRTFVITFVTLIVTFVYQILGLLGIVPTISESAVTNILTFIVNILATFGVLVDPTTPGTADSERALTYFTDEDVRNIEG